MKLLKKNGDRLMLVEQFIFLNPAVFGAFAMAMAFTE